MPDEPVGFDITGTSEHLGLCFPGCPMLSDRMSFASHRSALLIS